MPGDKGVLFTKILVAIEILLGVSVLALRVRRPAFVGVFLLSSLFMAVHIAKFFLGVPPGCSCYGWLSTNMPIISLISSGLLFAGSLTYLGPLLMEGREVSRWGIRTAAGALGLTMLMLASLALAKQSKPCLQVGLCSDHYFCTLQSSNGSDTCSGASWTAGQYVTKTAFQKTRCQPSDDECTNNNSGLCYHITVFNSTPCISSTAPTVFCYKNEFCGPLPPAR